MYSLLMLLVALSATTAWLLYTCYCLLANYRKVRHIGLPLRIIPISPENPFWMIVDKRILIPFFELLPFGTGSFTRYNWRGWEFKDKANSHLEMGDAFVIVTPGRNWFYLCNAEALVDVFHRRSDFPRPLEIFGMVDWIMSSWELLNAAEMVNIFGQNLSTTDGQQWQRHRKVTATCFNERNNELVWSESLKQARGMLEYWTGMSRITSVADDTRTFSLHVLASAGFGKRYPFRGHLEASAVTGYKESLQMILDNCILLMVLGENFLSKPWLPRKLRKLHAAVGSFRSYMTEVYEEEKASMAQGKPESNNLMTSLIRSATQKPNGSDEYTGLTESEVYGNIFVFNFAGHDTTAHTLAFAVVLLATKPLVQDWLHEELTSVMGKQREDSGYSETFPKLNRCLAILFETVRLYTPVPIAKSTGPEPRRLIVNHQELEIPANTMVIPSHVAVHTHPRYWGEDSLEWRPSRWIQSYTGKREDERMMTPVKGSFVAWSEGVRNCPGKKFSQVEFVAAMATLFREWRVDPVCQVSESVEMARRRVLAMVENETGQVLLLQLLHPEKACLTWTPR